MSIIVKNGGLEKQLTSLKNMQHLGLQKSCFGLRSSSNPVSITFLLLVLERTFLGFECSLKCIFLYCQELREVAFLSVLHLWVLDLGWIISK